EPVIEDVELKKYRGTTVQFYIGSGDAPEPPGAVRAEEAEKQAERERDGHRERRDEQRDARAFEKEQDVMKAEALRGLGVRVADRRAPARRVPVRGELGLARVVDPRAREDRAELACEHEIIERVVDRDHERLVGLVRGDGIDALAHVARGRERVVPRRVSL